MAHHTLGFDIGGTKCAVVIGSDEGSDEAPRIVAKHVFATRDFPGPRAAVDELAKVAGRLCGEHEISLDRIAAAGISCGGPLHGPSGRILSPPNLPGWIDIPIVQWLGEALGLPVRLQNDANAGALAEWRWGAGRGANTVIFLTFGTGMGAGLIINGRLHEGRDDLAGEVGHWRLAEDGPEGFGKRGSFEGFCSGGGMARLAREQVREAWKRGEKTALCADEEALAGLDVHRLSIAARQGDPLAREVFGTAAARLGQGLALMIDLLNPDAIVIGSIFARCEDLLREAMEAVVLAETLPATRQRCRVVPAQLGEHIGDYASLAVAGSAIPSVPR